MKKQIPANKMALNAITQSIVNKNIPIARIVNNSDIIVNKLTVLGIFAMGAFRILPSIAKISSRINALIYYQPFLQNATSQ